MRERMLYDVIKWIRNA